MSVYMEKITIKRTMTFHSYRAAPGGVQSGRKKMHYFFSTILNVIPLRDFKFQQQKAFLSMSKSIDLKETFQLKVLRETFHHAQNFTHQRLYKSLNFLMKNVHFIFDHL